MLPDWVAKHTSYAYALAGDNTPAFFVPGNGFSGTLAGTPMRFFLPDPASK